MGGVFQLALLQAHRLTAQFCMWDQYKVLGELGPAALTHLARLHAALVVKDVLPLTCLKVRDGRGVRSRRRGDLLAKR